MTQHPNPPLGGDEAVSWHKMAVRQPEPGHKFVALFDDGSGAWLGFAHDGGVIDSDGDDHTKMPNAEWWAYLPSGFRMACEDHPVENYNLPDHVCPPLAAPVLPVEVREAESLRRVAEEMADLLALATSPDRFGEAGTGDVYLRMVAAERRFRTIKGDA